MKRYWIIALLLAAAATAWTAAAPSQVEFSATLVRIDSDPTLGDTLIMGVTPEAELAVRVTPSTEIRDLQNLPIGVGALETGSVLKIEGIFTDVGILAQEVKVTDDETQFELRGLIESVDAQARTVSLLGFTLEVSPSAQIRDRAGNPIPFDDLQAGDRVKAEGVILAASIEAREITLLTGQLAFAEIEFEGRVERIEGDRLFVSIQGVSGEVPVTVAPSAELRGDIVEGAQVEVKGLLNPDLTVTASRVRVLRPFQAVPDELRMDFGQTRRVDVVLRNALAEDLVLSISSRNASGAQPSVDTLTIPAGTLSAPFEVTSGSFEVTTFVDITAPVAMGGFTETVKVEVETDNDNGCDDSSGDDSGGCDDNPTGQLVEIKWSPDKISGQGNRSVEVSLLLTRTLQEDVEIILFLKDGKSALVSFPSMMMIAAGERVVRFPVEIGSGPGRAKVRAALPASVGGDTDDLEIDLRAQQQEKVELSWRPQDDLELQPGQSASVTLALDRPAPFDFSVAILVDKGDPALVSGVPSEIFFPQGSMAQTINVTAGDAPGKVEFEAQAPFSLGGDRESLKIEIEN
ncbi:MAG TPA: DUF5666 domain-containing protein [Acidobacteriota bacterium]|nr:DUF5666 domain-containing protein [Acidobacteriota bacterium]